MRIIHVTPRYFPSMGGVEVVVQKISETLSKKGIQMVVYSVDRNSNLTQTQNINGVLVKRFIPLAGDPLYLPQPKFVASLRKEKADIIHVHNIHTLPPFIVALCKRGNQKLLLQPHYHRYGQSPFRHSMLGFYQKAAFGTIFSQTNAIIANSTYEKRILAEDFPKAKNVLLVPEGIDVDEVRFVKRTPEEPKRILYVGALVRYKNVDKLIEAFAYLLAKESGNFKLIIVGDGPERDSLVNLTHSLGISDFVEWKNMLRRQELLHEYSRASVLAMLSPLESFSRVVYEALLVGLPAVVLDFGALKHLVAAGFAEGVKSLTAKDVAGALLKAPEKTYTRISSTADAFLDWKSYSERLLNIYRKLCEG
ncbi:MAG: glycosyltransferase family 4 protein [Candidatus Bathyarchaeota archaeon]|nr:glycosyltransferase family 4 protein [Candidatus Bathyarchaeota archaeon]